MSRVVVLPAPLGPTKASTAPRGTLRSSGPSTKLPSRRSTCFRTTASISQFLLKPAGPFGVHSLIYNRRKMAVAPTAKDPPRTFAAGPLRSYDRRSVRKFIDLAIMADIAVRRAVIGIAAFRVIASVAQAADISVVIVLIIGLAFAIKIVALTIIFRLAA